LRHKLDLPEPPKGDLHQRVGLLRRGQCNKVFRCNCEPFGALNSRMAQAKPDAKAKMQISIADLGLYFPA
jgi:hypothetical protein